ncbi:MAG: HlyD family efflux transporter periplasmic adaptor subunit [Planctomycetota bacterium]|nr:HlyD family efflux transporter periplasmic adaptor subunit [Planctomycetota bacterium]
MKTCIATLIFLFLAAAVSPAASAQEEKPPAEAKEEAVVVERGDLQVLVEGEGTLDAVRRKKLRVMPEEFAGPYTVIEMLPSGQMVEPGAVVARLETVQLLHGKELALKQQENWQTNREQELAQIEKMYKDAQLSSDTKEIVLERTRREVVLGREGLGLTRNSEKQLKEFEHPSQKEKLHRAVEQKQQDLELAKTAVRVSELQKSEEAKAAERLVRDSQERLARLESDQALMTIKAPFAGVLRHSGIEAGDKLAPNVAFADLLDLGHFEVRFLLTLRDLQVVRVGDKALVRLADLPELEVDGKIEEVALTAWPEGQDKGPPRYLVRAKLDDNKQLRHGARARVEIRGEALKKVIAILRTAVFMEEGRTYCKVRTEKGVAKREIVLGLGDRERVHVVRGLAEGETVVVKEGKK